MESAASVSDDNKRDPEAPETKLLWLQVEQLKLEVQGKRSWMTRGTTLLTLASAAIGVFVGALGLLKADAAQAEPAAHAAHDELLDLLDVVRDVAALQGRVDSQAERINAQTDELHDLRARLAALEAEGRAEARPTAEPAPPATAAPKLPPAPPVKIPSRAEFDGKFRKAVRGPVAAPTAR